MTYGAFGLVEVLGEANAVLVLDKMLKTAEVSYETQDTKCGGHALVFVSGSVSAVTAAVESIKEHRRARYSRQRSFLIHPRRWFRL